MLVKLNNSTPSQYEHPPTPPKKKQKKQHQLLSEL